MPIARSFRLELGVTREPANSRKYLDALYDGVSCRTARCCGGRARQSGVMLVLLLLGLKDGDCCVGGLWVSIYSICDRAREEEWYKEWSIATEQQHGDRERKRAS